MTLLYRIKCFFPKMFEFKYRHSATQRLCTVGLLLQRDPISFPRISNFSYLLTAYNASIYAMTLKTKNTCFTVENLRFVHAVRMIKTTFLAVFSLFGWEMLKMFCSWENSALVCNRALCCSQCKQIAIASAVMHVHFDHTCNPCIQCHW